LAKTKSVLTQIVRTYRETVSGTKGIDHRPTLKSLLREARQRHFDKVVVWSADWLARSMRHLVTALSELKAWQSQDRPQTSRRNRLYYENILRRWNKHESI
jgi:DNA invertase Pin-like site-specific DNA recombinase